MQTKPAPEEKRAAERFAVALAAEVGGVRAVTRDVSRAGAYLEVESPLEPREGVALTLAVPDSAGGDPFTVACQGRVVRLEPLDEGRWGVGVAFDEYSFRLPQDGRSC